MRGTWWNVGERVRSVMLDTMFNGWFSDDVAYIFVPLHTAHQSGQTTTALLLPNCHPESKHRHGREHSWPRCQSSTNTWSRPLLTLWAQSQRGRGHGRVSQPSRAAPGVLTHHCSTSFWKVLLHLSWLNGHTDLLSSLGHCMFIRGWCPCFQMAHYQSFEIIAGLVSMFLKRARLLFSHRKQ
jgi:hypothetical protein